MNVPTRADRRGHRSGGPEGLCCDCMDLQYGATLEAINEERAAKGKAPITTPWPSPPVTARRRR